MCYNNRRSQLRTWYKYLTSDKKSMRDELESIIKKHEKIYDSLSEEYEDKAASRVKRTFNIIDAVSPFFKEKGHILDVGCGVGVTTQSLLQKDFQVTAVDISPKMLAFTKKRNPEARCILGDFLTLDFDNKFDGILDFAFLHLFPKDVALTILEKNNRVLNTGGILFIGTTHSEKTTEGWEEKKDYDKAFERYRKHWGQEELKIALQETGFSILQTNFNTDHFNKEWVNVIAQKQ